MNDPVKDRPGRNPWQFLCGDSVVMAGVGREARGPSEDLRREPHPGHSTQALWDLIPKRHSMSPPLDSLLGWESLTACHSDDIPAPCWCFLQTFTPADPAAHDMLSRQWYHLQRPRSAQPSRHPRGHLLQEPFCSSHLPIFLSFPTLLYLLMVGQTSTREKKKASEASTSPSPTVLRPLSGSR